MVVCNAGQVRQFARSTGRLAKTDKLDAQDIAHFGEALQPVLYISMWSAIQYDPKIKAMYERLVGAGKPKKVALVACMRKQLTILNTMMKNGTHWDEKLA